MSKNSKSVQTVLFNFRKTFTIIIVFNIIFLVERAVFDFMGFMFGMIIADIVYLLFLIIGLFGAFQYRVNYVVALTLMTLLWIAWNIFVICVYLNIGMLDRYDPFVLNLNTGKKSWWFLSSFGCQKQITNELEQLQFQEQINAVKSIMDSTLTSTLTTTINTTTTQAITTTTKKPSSNNIFKNTLLFNSNSFDIFKTNPSYKYLDSFIQSNCFLPFYLIEIIHSALFILFGIFTIIFGLLLSNAFNDEDDTFDYIGGFDTAHMLSQNYNLDQQTLPRNGHIRLEPLYA